MWTESVIIQRDRKRRIERGWSSPSPERKLDKYWALNVWGKDNYLQFFIHGHACQAVPTWKSIPFVAPLPLSPFIHLTDQKHTPPPSAVQSGACGRRLIENRKVIKEWEIKLGIQTLSWSLLPGQTNKQEVGQQRSQRYSEEINRQHRVQEVVAAPGSHLASVIPTPKTNKSGELSTQWVSKYSVSPRTRVLISIFADWNIPLQDLSTVSPNPTPGSSVTSHFPRKSLNI